MALNTYEFGEQLKEFGFNYFTGVPCSYLKNLINYAINECSFIMAANEGDAVATASGAYLGGRKSVVLMQNSGLTNATSPLTSLNYVFKIPVLGFVSLRGEEGVNDEPQHVLMGKITEQMLELMDIPWQYLSEDYEKATEQLKHSHDNYIQKNKTFFFVVKKGTFAEVNLKEQPHKQVLNKTCLLQQSTINKPTRLEALAVINELKDNSTLQLVSTGKGGRELYEIEDSPHNLYMVGSMGCIGPLGLGLPMLNRKKRSLP